MAVGHNWCAFSKPQSELAVASVVERWTSNANLWGIGCTQVARKHSTLIWHVLGFPV